MEWGICMNNEITTGNNYNQPEIGQSLGDDDIILTRAYIGPNAEKICDERRRMNLAAGISGEFLGPVWFFYRKSYLVGFLAILLSVAIGYVCMKGGYGKAYYLMGMLYLFFANKIYLYDVRRKIERIKRKNEDKSFKELKEIVIKKGGTSPNSTIFYIIVAIGVTLSVIGPMNGELDSINNNTLSQKGTITEQRQKETQQNGTTGQPKSETNNNAGMSMAKIKSIITSLGFTSIKQEKGYNGESGYNASKDDKYYKYGRDYIYIMQKNNKITSIDIDIATDLSKFEENPNEFYDQIKGICNAFGTNVPLDKLPEVYNNAKVASKGYSSMDTSIGDMNISYSVSMFKGTDYSTIYLKTSIFIDDEQY